MIIEQERLRRIERLNFPSIYLEAMQEKVVGVDLSKEVMFLKHVIRGVDIEFVKLKTSLPEDFVLLWDDEFGCVGFVGDNGVNKFLYYNFDESHMSMEIGQSINALSTYIFVEQFIIIDSLEDGELLMMSKAMNYPYLDKLLADFMRTVPPTGEWDVNGFIQRFNSENC